ncbi:MAG: Lrp/AsnC family transcriptional regulator [Saprospiraceae bacterium]
MDSYNKEILEILQINARESFANIGKQVGLSAPAVGKRVRQLEEEGIIEGYALKVNLEKLGIETKAYITLKIHHGSSGTPFSQKTILQMKEVQRCDRITGDDCLCILGHFKNNKHLIAFLEEISKYGTTKTSIILEA